MPKPFDATLKQLVRADPRGWLALLGLHEEGPVQSLDVDLSTVSAAADTVLGLGDPVRLVADVEFQSGPDAALPRRLLSYNALLHQRFAVPVHSAVILLRPEAGRPGLTGVLRHEGKPGFGVEFRYEVIRLWTTPVETILAGPVGLIPLALLADVPRPDLPQVIHRLADRVHADAEPSAVKDLLTAAYVLTGMRLPKDELGYLFRGILMVDLSESSGYQLIMERGEVRAARRLLLSMGRIKFGTPADAAAESHIRAVEDFDRLERMSERLLSANSWSELVAVP